MNKKILYILLIIIIASIGFIIFAQSKDQKNSNGGFFECLKENGVTIYGTSNCPACKQLRENLMALGNNIDLVYVNCDEDPQRCATEMKTNYVPEIQINEVIFPNDSVDALSEQTGCKKD